MLIDREQANCSLTVQKVEMKLTGKWRKYNKIKWQIGSEKVTTF